MNTYPNLKARYSNGTLKLSKKLKLPDGAEVYVSVKPIPRKSKSVRATSSRRTTRVKKSRTVSLKPQSFNALVGVISVGGDALLDSERIYDLD